MQITKFGQSIKLIDGATAAGAGAGRPGHLNAIFQAILTGASGALHATVDIETTEEDETVVDADAHWEWLATFELTVANWAGTADDDFGSFLQSPGLGRVRGNVTLITGTGAKATLLMGV